MKVDSEKVGLKLNIQKTKTMASGPITSWQIAGEEKETVTDFTFLGSKITAVGDCSHEIKKCLLLGRKAMTSLNNVLKSRDITLPTKVHIVMYGCESWTIKKVECQRIYAFELWCWRTLESPSDYKEIKPVNPKGNQPWIFIERADAEASILWPSDGKGQLLGKDPDLGEVWGQEKRATEDEMVWWHHQLKGHESEQILGDSKGQGSLACCNL